MFLSGLKTAWHTLYRPFKLLKEFAIGLVRTSDSPLANRDAHSRAGRARLKIRVSRLLRYWAQPKNRNADRTTNPRSERILA